MAKSEGLKTVSRSQRRTIRNVLNSYCVPNLLKSHRKSGVDIVRPVENDQWIDRNWLEDVSRFCRPLALGDFAAAQHMVEEKLSQNISIKLIYKDYFPAAARLLGDMWLSDDCSFAEVTIGSSLIHQLVVHNAARLERAFSNDATIGSILIAPLSKETHILGVSLMETVYSAANWHAEAILSSNSSSILNAVKNQRFDVIAISLSDRKRTEECKLLLTKIRDASLNNDIIIAVGGHVFDQNPQIVQEVGADVQVTNIVDSLDQMKQYVAVTTP